MTRQHIDSLLVLSSGESNLYNNKNNIIYNIICSIHYFDKESSNKKEFLNGFLQPQKQKNYNPIFKTGNTGNSGNNRVNTLNNNNFLVTKNAVFVTAVTTFVFKAPEVHKRSTHMINKIMLFYVNTHLINQLIALINELNKLLSNSDFFTQNIKILNRLEVPP